jgi:hypothetical protein
MSCKYHIDDFRSPNSVRISPEGGFLQDKAQSESFEEREKRWRKMFPEHCKEEAFREYSGPGGGTFDFEK